MKLQKYTLRWRGTEVAKFAVRDVSEISNALNKLQYEFQGDEVLYGPRGRVDVRPFLDADQKKAIDQTQKRLLEEAERVALAAKARKKEQEERDENVRQRLEYLERKKGDPSLGGKSEKWQQLMTIFVWVPNAIAIGIGMAWLFAASTEFDEDSVLLALVITVSCIAAGLFAMCIGYIADRLTDIQGLLANRK